MERLSQQLLAGRVPHRRPRGHPPRGLRRGQLPRRREPHPGTSKERQPQRRLAATHQGRRPDADEETSPETYLGAERSQYLDGAEPVNNENAVYHFPASIPLPSYALSGRWLTKEQQIVAEGNSQLTLNFKATDVYLVLNGHGTIRVSLNGVYVKTIRRVGLRAPLHAAQARHRRRRPLNLQFSPGLEAYDFTFG